MTGLRMRFQLTPLLDLLLIVVFAQFLEGRQADETRAERAEERLEETLEELRVRDDERTAAVQTERRELADLKETLTERNARLRAERDRAVELARAAARTAQDVTGAADRSANLMAELLDVPTAIAAELKPEPRSDAAQDLAAARERIARLRDQKGFEVLRFLVGYEELLKRAEVWTLHVRGGGFVALSTGSRVELLRLEADGQQERAEEFVRKLFAATKILPQPKGLVVILVSFDRTARAGVYQPVLDGLGEAVRRLETDQGGRTQYEFAVLGAAPEPTATRDTPESAAGPPGAEPVTGVPPASGGGNGTLPSPAVPSPSSPTTPEPSP